VRAPVALALAAAAAFALGGCMEVEQTSMPSKQGKYQGKPDTPPWANEPLAHESAKWSKGDRTSWETQIKTRQLAQHEHKRIYQ
jgi:hypothetical protein